MSATHDETKQEPVMAVLTRAGFSAARTRDGLQAMEKSIGSGLYLSVTDGAGGLPSDEGKALFAVMSKRHRDAIAAREFPDAKSMLANLRLEPTREDLIEEARGLGEEAFARGSQRTPAHDSRFMALIAEYTKGRPIGWSLPIFDGWLGAWDRANLAAPVVGVTSEKIDVKPKGATRRR